VVQNMRNRFDTIFQKKDKYFIL